MMTGDDGAICRIVSDRLRSSLIAWSGASGDQKQMTKLESAILHLTNGDHAASCISGAGIAGTVVPWRDPLHEGPVPADLSLDELRLVRAHFIADQGWAGYLDVLADFVERDAALTAFARHEEVVLWFEHDLYDQIQLIQILAWLAGQDLGDTRLTMVVTDEYIGQRPVEAMQQLFDARRPVTRENLQTAGAAWGAFTSPDPRAIEAFLSGEITLPFLGAALRRHLEEFPATGHGLSRSERQALEAVAAGASSIGEAYVAAHHQREDAVFLSDVVFASYLERLGRGPAPLVVSEGGDPITAPRVPEEAPAFWKRRARITAAGRAVLDGWRDWIALAKPVRWLGGVELRGLETPWRWNARAASLVAVHPAEG
jgi:hypothetical protein